MLLSYLTSIISYDNVRNSLSEERKLVPVIAKDKNWKSEHFELVFQKYMKFFCTVI